ncbi:hypothetical protein ACFYXM_35945 [Streptomyces sp. NPDC002476]|uniref:hypothetical protein n=1 Tax=Streptomyces sp. NPDC002476 TaxID=3364648 RepID=UPI0036C5CEAE
MRPAEKSRTRSGCTARTSAEATSEPRATDPKLTTAAGPDGTIGWAIVHNRESTTAELDDLEQKLLARGAELAARYDQDRQRAGTGEGREAP